MNNYRLMNYQVVQTWLETKGNVKCSNKSYSLVCRNNKLLSYGDVLAEQVNNKIIIYQHKETQATLKHVNLLITECKHYNIPFSMFED